MRALITVIAALALHQPTQADAQRQPTAAAGAQAAAGEAAERSAVLATVQRFFDGMRARDAKTWEDILIAQGNTWRFVQDDTGRWTSRHSSNAEDVERLREGEGLWEERMFDPTVLVRGPVAVVWTPYTFHLDGEFSHCGIDVFNLIKVDGRWRMADAMWTVETQGCGELIPTD